MKTLLLITALILSISVSGQITQSKKTEFGVIHFYKKITHDSNLTITVSTDPIVIKYKTYVVAKYSIVNNPKDHFIVFVCYDNELNKYRITWSLTYKNILIQKIEK